MVEIQAFLAEIQKHLVLLQDHVADHELVVDIQALFAQPYSPVAEIYAFLAVSVQVLLPSFLAEIRAFLAEMPPHQMPGLFSGLSETTFPGTDSLTG